MKGICVLVESLGLEVVEATRLGGVRVRQRQIVHQHLPAGIDFGGRDDRKGPLILYCSSLVIPDQSGLPRVGGCFWDKKAQILTEHLARIAARGRVAKGCIVGRSLRKVSVAHADGRYDIRQQAWNIDTCCEWEAMLV